MTVNKFCVQYFIGLLLTAQNGGVGENGNYTTGASANPAAGDASRVTAVTSVEGSHRGGQRQELRIVIDSSLSSPVIDSLVLQTLAIIRTLVDK